MCADVKISPAMSTDVCVNRPMAMHLTQSVIVNRLSSSPFDVHWLENLNVMMAMMYSVAMAAVETHRHLIVTFPENGNQNKERRRKRNKKNRDEKEDKSTIKTFKRLS